ncbi:MAG: Gfo/Idh/MocA family oxidoreductase [Anaerolineales bacterium]|jgi:predicted dehydrogenase
MTHQRADGMAYAPKGKPNIVCQPGEFRFAAIGLNHGHINGQCNGLIEAGGELVWVYDPDPVKVDQFRQMYPQAQAADSESRVLEDLSIQLVASAAIPAKRCELGLRVLDHDKDYFADKPPLTTLDQLGAARQKVSETGRKYAVYYSERLHVESAVYAGELVEQGAIGRVVQVVNLAPHRLNAPSRPDWFWNKKHYGGILVDIGSHQIEQFLYYSGAKDARVLHSKVANYNSPQYPDFEDFGDATLVADNGATQYMRVDWFTPEALGVWGDGRVFILGTDGYIELRKYIDVGRDQQSDHVYLINQEVKEHIPVYGKIGFPYFGQLILDCLNRTDKAMTQVHAFKTIELAIQAQMMAEMVG